MGGIGSARWLVPLAVALAVLGAAPVASAYVYWSDASKGTIGRATNEGGAAEPNFITGLAAPRALAVDGTYIYWADEAADAIGRARLDGSGAEPKFILTGTPVTGVAVTGSYVFWSAISNNSIGRANLNGTSPNNNLVTGVSVPCGVAVDSGHLYWLSQDSPNSHIGRSDFGGLDKKTTFATLADGFQCGLAVDSLYLYWSDFGLGTGTTIGRADVSNGGGVDNSFIGGAGGPCGVAVFGSRLYWTNAATNTIGRANANGSEASQAFIATGGTLTCGVAVDALAPPPPAGPPAPGPTPDPPPQTTIKSGPGKKLAQGKAKFAFKSSEAGSSFQCKLDARKVTRCKSPRAYSGLKPGRHTFKVWATDAAGNKDATPAKRGFRVPAG